MPCLNKPVTLIVLIGFVFFAGFSLESKAQEKSNVQIDLGLTQNHQGFLKLFDGVIDAGFGYNHKITGNLFWGAGLNLAYFRRSGTTGRSMFYKPSVNLHYSIKISERLNVIPVVHAGYAFMNVSNKEFNYSETQSGLLSGATIRLLWATKQRLDYFIFGRFDCMYLNMDEEFTKLEAYRNVYLSSFGFGVRIKSKRNEE